MDEKAEIKSRTDIVELIGSYLPLKPSGGGSFKALCPFHGERTPSFHVSADKQIWHCFGCSKGGDCFAFVMEMDGMDFPEALRYLGEKVGIEVKSFSSEGSNEHKRLLSANSLAQKYYRKVLMEASYAAAARAYISSRGIPEELQEAFGLGFAPDTWDALAKVLTAKGFGTHEGEQAGLLLKRRQGSGMIDRFRARLMIPLRNAQGETVGFTGRVMPGAKEGEGAKYMNSPETPIYHKGRLLFGLDLAKRSIKEKGCVIVVEGNLDVVASHKAGITNVVASSGTALTEDQLTLLKRLTSTIVFSFDADAAGFKAAQRGIALARAAGFDVRATVLPPEAGKDPDEAVQKDPALWRSAVEKTVPIMQFYIDRTIAGCDLANVDEKRKVSAVILPELAQIKDAVEREHWLQVVSDLLRTDINVLRTSLPSPSVSVTPSPQPPPLNPSHTPARPSPSSQAESILLGLFLNDPKLRVEIDAKLVPALITDASVRELYRLAQNLYHEPQSPGIPANAETFFGRLRDRLLLTTETTSLVSLLDELTFVGEQFLAQLPPSDAGKQVQQLIHALSSATADLRKKALAAELRQAEAAGDKARVAELMQEFHSLT